MSVPVLRIFVKAVAIRLCWSWILVRSSFGNECRSLAYFSAVIPFTWWKPADKWMPLSWSFRAVGRQTFTPPSASITLTKARKFTST